MDHEKALTVAPWKRIAFDPLYGGSWVVAGDVDGDGEVEVITARNVNVNDVHYTCTVVAYKMDGSMLWYWGGPGAGRGELHHDVACQIHDWDGDGRQEVIVCDAREVVELDGATGQENRRLSLPHRQATDCLVFCNLQGSSRPTDVLVKTRYSQIWAFDVDWNLLWTAEHPGGYRAAHQPRPMDLDGDGRDEIMAGAVMLDPDGTVRWQIELEQELLKRGHLDCCRVLRRGAEPEDWRLAFTYCGSLCVGVIDGTGRVIWTREGEHYESIDIGNVLPDVPGPQIVVDIDKANWGYSPMVVFDEDGNQLARFTTDRSRQHDLVHWRSGDAADIVNAADRTIYDGQGKAVARLTTDPVDRIRSAFACDLTGDGREDLLLSSWYGTAAYLYRNPELAKPDPCPPLGTGMNFTYY